MLRLQRSGEGRVWLKLEGARLPSGSWFDRVVDESCADGLPRHVVVPAADAYAYAVALRLVPLGACVTVVDTPDASKRLRTLLAGAGARVLAARDPSGRDERVADLVASGASVWQRLGMREATERAVRELGIEVRAALQIRPSAWVLPETGLSDAALRRALDAPNGRLVVVPDDGERRRALGGDAACRRQQVAQREGVLLSPQGAECVTAALEKVGDVSGAVVAVIPEDGRRFVGWW